MAANRMKILTVAALACPVIAHGCGAWFYPAPPTLDQYPERLSVKTMRELMAENAPKPDNAATFDQLQDECRRIAATIGTAPTAEVLRDIDTVLARNRTGEYRKRFSNLLYDLRDLVTGPAAKEPEMGRYVNWRAADLDWDDGFFTPPPPATSWRFSPAELTAQRDAWQRTLAEKAARIKEGATQAPRSLKPHWLVQGGAWQFKNEQWDAAALLFRQVIEESPDHPRTQVARLMLARTKLEQWRRLQPAEKPSVHESPDSIRLYQETRKAFDDYLSAHPKGRYAADVPGWLGGIELDAGRPAAALEFFLEQTDQTEHPEIVRQAVRQCERCFEALDPLLSQDEPPDLPLADIARRPLASVALVYHFLDSESRRDFQQILEQFDTSSPREMLDRYQMPMLRIRRSGRRILPLLAKAVADAGKEYASPGWHPKYVAVLAWAASESGDHRQAIRIAEMIPAELERSDDLQYVRAIALQRAGDLEECVKAFRAVQQRFPESPLVADASFRVVTAVRDLNRPGAALVELFESAAAKERSSKQPELGESGEPVQRKVPPLHMEAETEQWIDTILQFAPIKELQNALATEFTQEQAQKLKAAVRMRLLAGGDFAGAKALAVGPTPANEDEPSELTGPDWSAALAKLDAPSSATKSRVPENRGEAFYRAAEAWASLRGRLTLPSLLAGNICGSEREQNWEQRARNARYFGIPDSTAAANLESRDELSHAYRLYLQSAEAGAGTATGAKALLKANDAILAMAELSPWSYARAFETGASQLSRELHARLQREYPNSPEAKESAWWTFVPPAEYRWLPGNGPSYELEAAITKVFNPAITELWPDYGAFCNRLNEIAAGAEAADSAKLVQQLEAIRGDLMLNLQTPSGASILNDIDDLLLFLQEPGLSPAARAKYFSLRLGNKAPDVNLPELQPWRDYLAFLALVREQGQQSPDKDSALVRPMSQRMREFLTQFPKSRKREAALARLAIASVRESHRKVSARYTEWAEAPNLRVYKTLEIVRAARFNREQAFSALEAYAQEFPQGRYAADVRLWRGAALLETRRWAEAMAIFTATLDDQKHRDLHLDAALHLAYIFMQLLDAPNERLAIVEALKNNPRAQERLSQFMKSETLGARLRCLEGFLTAGTSAPK